MSASKARRAWVGPGFARAVHEVALKEGRLVARDGHVTQGHVQHVLLREAIVQALCKQRYRRAKLTVTEKTYCVFDVVCPDVFDQQVSKYRRGCRIRRF